jgi:hypothetical protein
MTLRKKIPIILIVLLISAAAGWLTARYYFSAIAISNNQPPDVAKEIIEELSPIKVIGDEVDVKIFHPSQDGIIAAKIKVRHSPLHVEMVEIVMTEYLKGLGEKYEGTKVLGVYRDRLNVLYIDLSDEFRRNFSGDAMQEFLLLQSLYNTIITNFPWVQDVRLLIEGKEVESIGGHFLSLYGLKEIFAD